MKIAILTERLKTGFGVDLVVHEQAKRLANKHEVTVFAIDIDKEFVKKTNYSVFQLQIPLFFNPVRQDYATYKCFAKYKHSFSNFDVFVIHTPTYNAWTHALSKMGKVLTCYYGNSPSYGYVGLKKYRKQIFDVLEKNIYFRKTEKIVSISNYLKNSLPLKLRSKTVVNHLGKEHVIDSISKISGTEQSEILDTYFIDKKDILITYIGRLDYRNNPYKNTNELLDLKKRIGNGAKGRVKFFALGFPQNGIEKEMFDAGISVVPTASAEDLAVILSKSYIYFSPSRWEGFNLPFLEAQALGIPVVGYKIGAHEEVVCNGKSGFLVNTFDEIVEKVNLLLKDTKLRKKMSQAALMHAGGFSWDKNVEILEKYL